MKPLLRTFLGTAALTAALGTAMGTPVSAEPQGSALRLPAFLFRQASPDGAWLLATAAATDTSAPDSGASHGMVRIASALVPASPAPDPDRIAVDDTHALLLGMEIEQAAWDRQGRWCAFTARHSGGVAAWNHPAYLLDPRTGKLYALEPLTGPVVDPSIRMGADDSVTVWVGGWSADGSVVTDSKTAKTEPLSALLTLKPTGNHPRWTAWKAHPTLTPAHP